VSDKKDPRERFAELLGIDSKNFLGTGLTMQEFSLLHSAEKIATSWALQPREERSRRLATVVQLSVELTRIREVTNFSTRLAELAIESVIEGDWTAVKDWTESLGFEDEREELRQRYAPIFATFRELLLQVLRAGKELPA